MSFTALYSEWERKRWGEVKRADDYLTARQTARSTSILAPPDLRTTYYTPLRWCQLVTGAIEERMSITDVQTSSAAVTTWLRKTWRAVEGALVSSRAHWRSGGDGRAYVAVTTNQDGTPRLTVLPAKNTVHAREPETGRLTEALHLFDSGRQAAYYEVGRTTHYRKTEDGWVQSNVDPHGYDRVQIVVFAYQADDGYGEPWARSIWGLQDAASRVATDGAIAGALMAVPQRVILGATQEEQSQSTEKLYLSRLLTLTNKDSKIEQFAAAQLQQFGTLLTMFARQAASITGLPVQHFGITSEANPTSGDSKREDKSRIDTRADRIARDFGAAWHLVLDLILDFYPGTVSETVRESARVIWDKPNRPTPEAMGDVGVKLASAKHGDRPMFSRQFILKTMGLPQEEIEAELELTDRDTLEDLIRDDDDSGSPVDQ